MELFFESVVSPSSERARRVRSSSEATSSSDKESLVDEEEESPSSSLASPLAFPIENSDGIDY
jgi:hypothetical protein